jgi:hypothetical protein
MLVSDDGGFTVVVYNTSGAALAPPQIPELLIWDLEME